MATRGKGKKLNKAWLHEHLTDPYVKLAQREGYRARAAYKLKEVDEKLHTLAPGALPLGPPAAPVVICPLLGARQSRETRGCAAKGRASPRRQRAGGAAGAAARRDRRAR